ncbi:MAG TPA: 2-amino-4-hydroxy-6-hydroxymethyldihydropteridine diphosphokinase [Dehalococcoidia bacterium]
MRSSRSAPAEAYIALGSNIGDREANLRAALRAIEDGARVADVSALYETEAVTLDDSEGPPYLNAACRIETDLDPVGLVRVMQAAERRIGRSPLLPRWSPRPIDLDLLLYGNEIIETDDLTVPHPLMAERPFVLTPLVDIAADVIHPVLNRTIAELAREAGNLGVRRIAEAGWERVPS